MNSLKVKFHELWVIPKTFCHLFNLIVAAQEVLLIKSEAFSFRHRAQFGLTVKLMIKLPGNKLNWISSNVFRTKRDSAGIHKRTWWVHRTTERSLKITVSLAAPDMALLIIPPGFNGASLARTLKPDSHYFLFCIIQSKL